MSALAREFLRIGILDPRARRLLDDLAAMELIEIRDDRKDSKEKFREMVERVQMPNGFAAHIGRDHL